MKFYKISFLILLSASFIATHFAAESAYAHKGKKKYVEAKYKKKSRKMLFNFALRHSTRLGLSKSQISKLKILKTSFKKARIMNRAKLRITRLDLKTAIRTEPINMKEIKKLVKKGTSQREIMWLSTINAIVKTKTILTSKQLEKMRRIMKTKRKRRIRRRRKN